MARPAKSVKLQSDGTKMTTAERNAREETEEKLRGSADALTAPADWPESRIVIFDEVVKELTDRGIVGNLDYFVIKKFSTSMDMLNKIDATIDAHPEELQNAKMRNAREMYSRDFFRCCTELCLSPSSRAKIAIKSAEKAAKPKSVFDIVENED